MHKYQVLMPEAEAALFSVRLNNKLFAGMRTMTSKYVHFNFVAQIWLRRAAPLAEMTKHVFNKYPYQYSIIISKTLSNRKHWPAPLEVRAFTYANECRKLLI